ncbi:low-specificity D-threonine aldolase [hydrothermal vent metagenome]|uniref:Low-specificity D-threonine aldolase n=1 Tax=hydrothermal vent metagenome TaxID=652676 RepID=A0A3B1DCQ5_9ZZZZ
MTSLNSYHLSSIKSLMPSFLSSSFLGCHQQELDTPSLCIDLDLMEANILRMAKWMTSRGKQWRPHQKCHKTPQIALKQIEAGAMGVTCAKLTEAEVMAEGGVENILVANMIAGDLKWNRAARLSHKCNLILACDHYTQVEPFAAICRKQNVTCQMIIEVNIGLDRVGIPPGVETIQLAQAIDKLEGVELVGIMGYEGHLLQIENQEEKQKKIYAAMNTLKQCRDQLLAAGLCCDIVSAGGTGSFQISADCDGLTEIQAGGGIFADPFYRKLCHLKGHDEALSILTTVVSRPTRTRAIIDAGRKSHYPDFMMPTVKNIPEAKVVCVNAEHCELELSGDSQNLKIGDKIELIPGYADFTTVLHDNFFCFRNQQLETIYPIAARGMLW